ncbi:MAG: alanine:cation symporter family protein, partial [Crocinitomicaceae bacterium]
MKYLIAVVSTLLPFIQFAQEQGMDEKIDKAFGWLTGPFVGFIFYQIEFTEDIKVYWVLFPLILGALFFTIYFRLINFSGFVTAINVVRGKYDDIESAGDETDKDLANVHSVDGDIIDTIRVESDEDHHGEVSHFQALTAALSATVGLGNIAGVAIALTIGGAGATFWMIVAGFLGMASKFVECTLGVKYREIAEDGTVYGGPMYYLKNGLKSKGMKGFGAVLAVVFAIMCIGGSFG